MEAWVTHSPILVLPYITALALNGECQYVWVNSFFSFFLILKAEVPQESEMWHQPLRTPRAHFTLTAWCSLLSQVYFLAAVNQISVPFVIFNTNVRCPSLCFYSRNFHCLQMKLQALWAHFTFIFMTDEIRQEPSEPDTRSVEGSGRTVALLWHCARY